jgi:hypothetical protein
LTCLSPCGNVRPMAEHPGTERKKHRHDLGHEDHGPKLAAGTTRTIQGLLGLWIALTLGFVVYALVDSTRPHPPTSSVPVTK